MPFRDCKCPSSELDSDTFKCVPVTVQDLKDAKGDKEAMQKLSRHMLGFNAFGNAPLADVIHNILPF